MARKMDDAARERLAKAAEKRKADRGRTSLRGLDPEGWAASLDAVLDGTVVCPPIVKPDAAGGIHWKNIGLDLFYRGHRPKPLREDHGMGSDVAYFAELGQWNAERETVSFVRVMQARAVMLEDLARAFPVRYLAIKSWHRAVTNYVTDKVPVFRAADIVAVFAAIWPEPADGTKEGGLRRWQVMCAKYLRGYTVPAAEEYEWTDYAKPPTCSE